MNLERFRLGCALLLAALLLFACGRRATPEELEDAPASAALASASPGSAAAAPSAGAPSVPNGTLEVISAARLRARIASSGAKATLVNAWASWCGPCRREVPMLQGLEASLSARGVEVVLVSVDEPEDVSKALAFLSEQKITLKSYLAERPLDGFKRDMNPRWPGMLPATFLFDAEGKLRYFWGGEAFEHELLPVIEAFLAGKPIDGEKTFLLAPGKVEN